MPIPPAGLCQPLGCAGCGSVLLPTLVPCVLHEWPCPSGCPLSPSLLCVCLRVCARGHPIPIPIPIPVRGSGRTAGGLCHLVVVSGEKIKKNKPNPLFALQIKISSLININLLNSDFGFKRQKIKMYTSVSKNSVIRHNPQVLF